MENAARKSESDNEMITISDDEMEMITISDDEIEIITISDDSDSDSDVAMYDPDYDRDVNIVLDDIEEMEVDIVPIVDEDQEEDDDDDNDDDDDDDDDDDKEEEEEDLHDDGYDSENAVRESCHSHMFDIRAVASLDEHTRVCTVTSYVMPYVALWGSVRICMPCFMRNRGRFISITTIESHTTSRYVDAPQLRCTDCQGRLYVFYLANACPTCQGHAESDDSDG
ncbi:nucleolin-like [Nylanderia fulva]|uniref:nucleolin-like n=1 Tax=Nylanderia fulva TaxID=613905 RepID=UPI0010FBB83C|nr:nucleolin-like [Nylanderia fulva]